MTIGKINGSNAPLYDGLALSAIEDPLLAAAALQLSTEHEIQKNDELDRQLARQAKLAADRDAVKHLLDKADAIRTGALTSLAFTAAGTAVQAYGASRSIAAADKEFEAAGLREEVARQRIAPELVEGARADADVLVAQAKQSNGAADYAKAIGSGISGGRVIGDQIIGQAGATEEDARSQAAKSRADAAQSVVDALKDDRKKSEQAIQTTLELVRQILDSQHQTAMAVVNRT